MHTRKPDERRAPKRYDDLDYSSSPASSSPTENSAREKNSRVPHSSLQQQLKSSTPSKRKARRNRNSYRGPVIPFTPILSSTTFPTDHQAHPDTTPDQESTISASDSDEQEETVHHPLGCFGREDSHHLPNMFSVPPNAATAGLGPRQRPTITVDNTPTPRAGANLRGQGLGPNDNGPNNSTFMRNMELMGEGVGMNDFDRTMNAMKDSDEDEPEATAAQAIAQELARGIHEYSPSPSWDDLTNALKLDVADAVNALYDVDPETIMNVLRLDGLQKDDLNRLLNQRTQRQAEEDRNGKLLKDHQREILLNGGSISSEESRDMMDRTIYRSTDEDNFIIATRAEVNKAKRYLRHIGFDPSILKWTDPYTEAPVLYNDQFVEMTARMGEPSSSDGEAGEFSPPLAQLSTKDAQEKEKQSRTSSHRRAKASGLIHAHSSPAAPHAVPSRSFPVTSAHARAQQPIGHVPRPSPHDDRGRSVLRTNNMPSGQKYSSQPRLPPPPTEHFESSATGRLPTRSTLGAPINNNKHATNPPSEDGRNKRKFSIGGSPEDGAGRYKPHSAATRDYHVATPAE